MKRRYNTEDLVDIHTYHTKLQRTIDEYIWNNKDADITALEAELDTVKQYKDDGHVYYPLF
jgi:hypothetical protein